MAPCFHWSVRHAYSAIVIVWGFAGCTDTAGPNEDGPFDFTQSTTLISSAFDLLINNPLDDALQDAQQPLELTEATEWPDDFVGRTFVLDHMSGTYVPDPLLDAAGDVARFLLPDAIELDIRAVSDSSVVLTYRPAAGLDVVVEGIGLHDWMHGLGSTSVNASISRADAEVEIRQRQVWSQSETRDRYADQFYELRAAHVITLDGGVVSYETARYGPWASDWASSVTITAKYPDAAPGDSITVEIITRQGTRCAPADEGVVLVEGDTLAVVNPTAPLPGSFPGLQALWSLAEVCRTASAAIDAGNRLLWPAGFVFRTIAWDSKPPRIGAPQR